MEKLIDMKLEDYINKVDSPSPAPGGGSVMGAVGSLACALAGMVGHLTINKNKFKELTEEEKNDFNNAIEKIKEIKIKLIETIDKDAESFNIFMDAIKLPKNTEEEKLIRKNEISKASVKSTETPFNILKYSYQLIPLFDIILKYGNSGVITDIASAYILIYAASKGSILNININTTLIEDKIFLEDIKKNSSIYIEKIESKFREIENKLDIFRIK
ncbi:cyclodeaminase/cyclohydrolase family protein [Brachyspira catarrhinii]|uniref:Formiminotransferase-cyclodeaminase n=1 Tax=Brachyspira catarrhinii TaxID=2528966 RepID=A0ABY2TTX3_9SPIR|nr:cyclodeaminase/cyclohydrolase family protein [Brachyspira catarrhinii]TKZ35636.1 formiminotransferase-cyclodeaminase [Brachyspira catarrhinii]